MKEKKELENLVDLAAKVDFEIIEEPIKPIRISIAGTIIEAKRKVLTGEDYDYLLVEEAKARSGIAGEKPEGLYAAIKRHIIFLSADHEKDRIDPKVLEGQSINVLSELKNLLFSQFTNRETIKIKKN